ncbi:hypothetical protein [Cellulomonas sp. C5510]|uniref:hypothetical protein n=1 Tax=Cellulomonas sp. C5510 TaxID=2871170 RepID=UPI001C947B13|nr:hypothetical protein [Cellulomonas sp. C5510]QZN86221.1 hypothetical protein K5O09_03200 [Cellulomonas sp. C5510]
MGTRWFRRRWDERRGDAFDAWGGAIYYFEVDDDGVPTRQIEVYDAGPLLQYGPGCEEDALGQLAQGPRDRDEDWSEWAISREEFQAEWDRGESVLWSAGLPDGGAVVLVGRRQDGLANELARIAADGRRLWSVESPASSDGWLRARVADGYVQAWSWGGWRIDYELSSGRELGRTWAK